MDWWWFTVPEQIGWMDLECMGSWTARSFSGEDPWGGLLDDHLAAQDQTAESQPAEDQGQTAESPPEQSHGQAAEGPPEQSHGQAWDGPSSDESMGSRISSEKESLADSGESQWHPPGGYGLMRNLMDTIRATTWGAQKNNGGPQTAESPQSPESPEYDPFAESPVHEDSHVLTNAPDADEGPPEEGSPTDQPDTSSGQQSPPAASAWDWSRWSSASAAAKCGVKAPPPPLHDPEPDDFQSCVGSAADLGQACPDNEWSSSWNHESWADDGQW